MCHHWMYCFLLLGLSQLVREPTFVPSGNILDLVLVSDVESVGEVYVEAPFPGCQLSPVVFSLQVGGEPEKADLGFMRLWFKGNYRMINEQLLMLDWDAEFETLNAEECYCRLLDVLDRLVESFIPEVEISSREPSWISRPPRSLIRRRAEAWTNYTQVRSSLGRSSDAAGEAWERYSVINVEYRSFSFRQRWDYEIYRAIGLAHSPKLFHSYIRRKKKGRPPVGPLRVQGEVISHPAQMAEVFANSFEAVYDSSAPVATGGHQVCLALMSPLALTYDDVLEWLLQLDVNKSPGPDGIHPKLLRECAAHLAYPLFFVLCQVS